MCYGASGSASAETAPNAGSTGRSNGPAGATAISKQRDGPQQCRPFGFGRGPSSGNAAFDDYRTDQLKRLDEERRRLDNEINEFHDYLRNLNMARDREEFDRFMRDRQNRTPSTQGPTSASENGPSNTL